MLHKKLIKKQAERIFLICIQRQGIFTLSNNVVRLTHVHIMSNTSIYYREKTLHYIKCKT